jgi:hypothetical protein
MESQLSLPQQLATGVASPALTTIASPSYSQGSAPATLPQAIPGAFDQGGGYSAGGGYYPSGGFYAGGFIPTVPGAACPQGFLAGKYPGTCFPSGDNPNAAVFFQQNAIDPLVAAQAALNMATVPKVSVSVSSPQEKAAQESEAAAKEVVAEATAPKSKLPLVLAGAGLLALFFVK